MNNKKTWFLGISLLAMTTNGIYAADVQLKADFKQLDEKGNPAGWTIEGKYKFATVSDDESNGIASFVATEKNTVYIYSPRFAVVPDKNYTVTFKFKSKNFGTNGYDKISSSACVKFMRDAQTHFGNYNFQSKLGSGALGQIGFPYTDVLIWKKLAINFKAPEKANLAYVMINVSNDKDDAALPEIQLCDFIVRELPNDPPQDSVTVDVKAAKLARKPAADKIENELLTTKKNIKGTICYGPYAKIPAGIYDVTVKVMTGDNSSDDYIFGINIESQNICSNSFVRGKEFKEPNKLQDFTFRVLKPDTEGLNLPCCKAEGVNITIDSITVKPVKQFVPQAVEEFYSGN